MTDQSPEQIEIERLRAKNVELLAEVKAARAEAKAAGEALEAAQAERDNALAETRRVTLDGPVDALLDDMSVDGPLLRMKMEACGYRFVMQDGQIALHDADGNVLTMPGDGKGKPDVPVQATRAHLERFLMEGWQAYDKRSRNALAFANLIKAPDTTGGGAGGHVPPPARLEQPAPPPAPSNGLGLR